MSDEPPRKQEPDTFKQHYAGTSIAKGQVAQHYSVNPSAQSHDANQEENPLEKMKRAWEFIIKPEHSGALMAIFTMLIFLSGVAYTVFSALQWCAVKDSNRSTREAFQISQRPIVVVTTFQLTDLTGNSIPKPIVGQPILVNVRIRNIGNSVALNAVVHRHLLFGSHVSEFRIEPADREKNGVAIDKEADDMTTAVSLKDTFANESIEINPADIVNWDGSRPIVVFGRISYEDAFGNSYCTPYAKVLLPNGAWQHADGFSGLKQLCPTGML